MTPHRKAGHMTALVPATNFLLNPLLNPKGRPHMDGVAKPRHGGSVAVARIPVNLKTL